MTGNHVVDATHVTRLDAASTPPADAPIPALLPRDWPRAVDALCDDLAASPAAREAAKRLVDSWVLAATTDDVHRDVPR